MSKLKKCPFCGGEAKIDLDYVRKEDVAMILYKAKCTRCPVDVGRQWFWEQEEAINAWNNRKPMEEVVEKLEEAAWMTDPTYDDDGYSNDDGILVITARRALRIVKETAC